MRLQLKLLQTKRSRRRRPQQRRREQKPQSVEEYAQIQSPYNTYLNPGLPPGPIANPGLSAIEASRNPAATAFCFFLATGEDRRHIFAQTFAEHQQNLQTYGYQ